jgi:hypothetical protein
MIDPQTAWASSASCGIPSVDLISSIAASTAASSRATSSGRQRLQARKPSPRASPPSAKKRTFSRRGWRAAHDGRQ